MFPISMTDGEQERYLIAVKDAENPAERQRMINDHDALMQRRWLEHQTKKVDLAKELREFGYVSQHLDQEMFYVHECCSCLVRYPKIHSRMCGDRLPLHERYLREDEMWL